MVSTTLATTRKTRKTRKTRRSQSVEPAPRRKKQKWADKGGGGGGGGGGDGLDGVDKATGGNRDGDSPVGGPAVSGEKRREVTQLPPQQDALLEQVQASAGQHSFDDSGRKKLAEIAEDCSKGKKTPTGTSTADILRAGCTEYSEGRPHALRTTTLRRPTPAELRGGGMKVFVPNKDTGAP